MTPLPSFGLLAEATAVAVAAWPPAILVWLRQTHVPGLPLRPFLVALAVAVGWSVLAFAAMAEPPPRLAAAARSELLARPPRPLGVDASPRSCA